MGGTTNPLVHTSSYHILHKTQGKYTSYHRILLELENDSESDERGQVTHEVMRNNFKKL